MNVYKCLELEDCQWPSNKTFSRDLYNDQLPPSPRKSCHSISSCTFRANYHRKHRRKLFCGQKDNHHCTPLKNQ